MVSSKQDCRLTLYIKTEVIFMKFVRTLSTYVLASLLCTCITIVDAMKRGADPEDDTHSQESSLHKRRKTISPIEEFFATPHEGLFAGTLNYLPPEIQTRIADFAVGNGTTQDIRDLLHLEQTCAYLYKIGHTNSTMNIRITPKDLTNNLTFTSYLTSLASFFSTHINIKHINLDVSKTNISNEQLQLLLQLPRIKSSLISLDCSCCYLLTSLPTLPATLKKLDLSGCPVTQLPTIPPTLQILICSFCYLLTSLPALPPTLRTLFCSYCSQLKTLPALPVTIKKLDCSSCPITQLPSIPPTLKKFFYFFCDQLKTATLPQSWQNSPMEELLLDEIPGIKITYVN
jgi:hypothetical protein